MFTKGQTLTFTQAAGTAYERPAEAVIYVGPYFYGFDEHVVNIPGRGETAVLERDLSA